LYLARRVVVLKKNETLGAGSDCVDEAGGVVDSEFGYVLVMVISSCSSSCAASRLPHHLGPR
jgi:hypothetical protein